MDPPEHTRLRRLLTRSSPSGGCARLEPRIVEIVDEHLDAMAAGRAARATSSADFALPMPSLVICELLGVPYADRAAFQQRTSRLLDLSLPMEERLALAREGRALHGRPGRAGTDEPGRATCSACWCATTVTT